MLTQTLPEAGTVLTRSAPPLTQEAFSTFGELMGFDAPIHTDPDYAAGTVFGRTFAQGMLLLSYFEPWLRDLFGSDRWSASGRLAGKLLSPAYAGEAVTLELTMRSIGKDWAALDLRILAGERLLAVGEAGVGVYG